MAASPAPAALHLDPPGPGPWTQDGVHFPRPMTRYFQDMHPAAFKAGTNDFARFYGMLIDGLQIAYVQGFGYNQLMPAPEDQIPARIQRAEEVYARQAVARAAAANGTRSASRRRSPRTARSRPSTPTRCPMPSWPPTCGAAATTMPR